MLTNIDPIDVYPKSLLDHELPDFLNKETIHIDENHLENWLINYKEKANYTRLLRYYLSTKVLDLTSRDIVLDVGGGDNIYASIIGESVNKVVVNDINISSKVNSLNTIYLEKDIFQVDFKKHNINKIVVGHALEHFRGDADIKLMELICKTLPPNGKCCIEPLFLGREYLEIFNYQTNELYDNAAQQIITNESNFPGKKEHNMGFARIYNSTSLYERILKVVEQNGLSYKLISFKINNSYLPDMEKYVFKRKNINYPLRALVLEKA
ncbi:methyltransferase type 11 [Bacillus cereus]|uniref:Uncharacterized protein n=1 Tax=Bacillus cereus TaxID=1396 RepID=A0A136C556_BACCE|nr:MULTISPECIES: hypothetical protein [Bacillus]EEL78762.1 Methyltransferase type 11 [Bacillus cereus AH1271]EEL84522.1 Methyltransferase type 11 [Bacillus cereus AH1272]EEL90416.1 Methyltransferase type 11 [Bacillus cereus AH1273]AYY25057.1 methyltransferase type 11 [Bacillus sp. FDAARGOS_527]KXI54841.1 methyltransferase type 11 [Bacillus cereus]